MLGIGYSDTFDQAKAFKTLTGTNSVNMLWASSVSTLQSTFGVISHPSYVTLNASGRKVGNTLSSFNESTLKTQLGIT